MPTDRTPADRLDEAVDALLAGERLPLDTSIGSVLRVAERLHRALTPVPPSLRFEAALARQLQGLGLGQRTLQAVTHPTRGRLIAAGAVSSAAVGVGVTAYAVWRTSRRGPTAPHRPWNR